MSGDGKTHPFIVVLGKREKFVQVVGFEQTPLLRILEDPIGQKLLEDLPMINLLFDRTAA